jgi:two-component system, OmpR family, response regulator ChvI
MMQTTLISVASPTSSPRPVPMNGAEQIRADPVRIAIVDDDDLFRESLGFNLTDAGYRTVSFPDGRTALDHFVQGGTFDLILLDWRMPGMDGIELLRELRARGVDVPVIFLTVLSDDVYEEAALAGGAVDFVEKSRSFPILLKRIRLTTERRRDGDGAPSGAAVPADETAAAVHKVGELEMRLDVARAFWRGVRVELTLTEFNIVKEMAVRPTEDISYRDLYDLVHGKGFVAGYGTSGYRANVRAFIKRIRQKFRSIDADFGQIENYAGFGYRWGEPAIGDRRTAEAAD